MNPTTARRNPAANQFLENPQPLPKLAEVIHCTRCGAKLRSTNINHAHIVTGPICTPCEQAIEAEKLERLWNQPMVDKSIFTPKKPKVELSKGKTEQSVTNDMNALAKIVEIGSVTAIELYQVTGVLPRTCKDRVKRLYDKGWLHRELENSSGGRRGYRYTITDKGLDELAKWEEANG